MRLAGLAIGVAAAAVSVISTSGAASANGQGRPAIAAGWFGYLEGRLAGSPHAGTITNDFAGYAGPADLGDGWAYAGRLGYRWASGWDVAIAGNRTEYDAGSRAPFPASATLFWQRRSGELTTIDLQIGRTFVGSEGSTMRLFAGGRHLGWEAYSIDTLNGYDHRVDTDGWGFLVGAEGAVAIAHRVKMIGGIEASFLAVDVHTRTSPAAFATNGTLDRGLMSAGGHLGLDFALSPNFSLSAGYRGTGYWGIEPTMGIHVQGGVLLAPGIGRGAVIDHGPFARLNFSFGN